MTLSHRLRKNFPATLVIPAGFIAVLSAEGIAQLVQTKLAVEERWVEAELAMGRTPPPHPRDPFHSTSAAAILARNPFDSQAHPPPPAAAPGEEDADPRNVPLCEGLKVLAIVASSDPAFSFAAFADGKDPRSLLRRRGGEVGSRTVEFIAWDRVWMGSGDRLCQAQMFAGEPQLTVGPPTPAHPLVGNPLDPTIAKGIQRVGPTQFNVDRSIVPLIIEKQAALMSPAHIVPEQEQGKVVGIRILGIRPESLLGTLGMETGDRLQTVNGLDVTSPEGALEAYARLLHVERLIVRVNRRGADMDLEYDIR